MCLAQSVPLARALGNADCALSRMSDEIAFCAQLFLEQSR